MKKLEAIKEYCDSKGFSVLSIVSTGDGYSYSVGNELIRVYTGEEREKAYSVYCDIKVSSFLQDETIPEEIKKYFDLELYRKDIMKTKDYGEALAWFDKKEICINDIYIYRIK